jgi:hypothetical protein
MPSLYIILDREIPGEDTYVNGNSLSKHNDELERMAKELRVTPLMDFFSVSKGELSSIAEDYGVDLDKSKPATEEKWFAAEEGLRTLHSLLGKLAESPLSDVDRIEAELKEFVNVLELAMASGIRWHLGVDY